MKSEKFFRGQHRHILRDHRPRVGRGLQRQDLGLGVGDQQVREFADRRRSGQRGWRSLGLRHGQAEAAGEDSGQKEAAGETGEHEQKEELAEGCDSFETKLFVASAKGAFSGLSGRSKPRAGRPCHVAWAPRPCLQAFTGGNRENGVIPTSRSLRTFTKGNEGNEDPLPAHITRFVLLVILAHFCSKDWSRNSPRIPLMVADGFLQEETERKERHANESIRSDFYKRKRR